MSRRDSPFSPTFLMAAALLALACLHLFFYKLGEEEITSETEARVLLTVTEMLGKRTWMAPTVGGEGRFETPPLYVWSVKMLSLFQEEPSPQAARLPSAISMFLLVLLGAWWTFQHISRYPREDNPDLAPEGMALLIGLMLASNPEIFDHARKATPDSLYALLSFAALYCFGESFEMRRSFYSSRPWRQWVMLGYFVMGLAMMTKGPIVYLFVLVPYMLTCRSYKMNKPDWVHIPGGLLSAAVGGWWYLLAMAHDPRAGRVFYEELVLKRFGAAAISRDWFTFYLELLGRSFFPWVLLSAVLAWRTIRQVERTPTREIWSWSLVSAVAWLSLVGTKSRDYFLPVAPFVLLLAGDALTHWDFEGKAGKFFRVLIRVVRWGLILALIPASLFFGSDLGLGLGILLAIACFIFLFVRHHQSYTYALWERTRQGAWFLVIAFIGVETAYIQDYIPRMNAESRVVGFVEHVKRLLPEKADLYLYKRSDSATYSYHFKKALLPLAESVDSLVKIPQTDTYLISDSDVKDLIKSPRLATLAVKYSGDRPKTGFFKVLKDFDPATSPTLDQRYALVPPLRLAFLGDGAKGDDNPKETAKRLAKLDDTQPFNEIVLVGNFLDGASRLERIEFQNSFERPYRNLIENGASFHGILGKADQPISWAVTRYPNIQMGGKNYYSRDFYGGLVRLYALDSRDLNDEAGQGKAQWAWIEKALMDPKPPIPAWRIVALYDPILSLAKDEENDDSIARRLLPLLDKAKVQIVVWSDEPWFQCVKDPEHFPVFLGAGFSGEAKPRAFAEDPRLRAAYGEEPGFLVLEITPSAAVYKAYDNHGKVVSDGTIERAGGLR